MTDLLTRLRHQGWRLTSQRRAVAEVLAGEHVHLTADEVHARAVRVLPEISRATVYNTLGELVALGEVREVSLEGRAKRYDPNSDVDHHHLVCTSCGLILDVPVADGAIGGLPTGARHGFEVDHVEVTYRGTCPGCAARPT
ncbi:transcriptional repressor [Aquihabitans sp. G128]|uniref:Fur family transcriptional regulator n=1 Tax=Aquihabitans sp. G128 TaxID=2849779 RepID=UPI001C2128EA|nr:Fur family transcriptional regulator [Aquihabitans sp. G128]QXC60194.1 transcriptional repressor [Aquihabitans sp. G128]